MANTDKDKKLVEFLATGMGRVKVKNINPNTKYVEDQIWVVSDAGNNWWISNKLPIRAYLLRVDDFNPLHNRNHSFLILDALPDHLKSAVDHEVMLEAGKSTRSITEVANDPKFLCEAIAQVKGWAG